jgi:putative metallohydrolase (TIGR04338 family)
MSLPPSYMDSMDVRVYLAEDAMVEVHGSRHFDSLTEVRRYVRELVAQPWFLRLWPQKMVFQVRDGRGRNYASCESADGVHFTLRFPKQRRERFYILHEVAHACSWNTSNHDHDVIFRKAVKALVQRQMGRGAVETLVTGWKRAGLAA